MVLSVENQKKGRALFDENENEDEENYQFDLKEQFEGKEGKKLLKLQSTFGYDKRFTMDSHFLEQDDTTELKNNDVPDTQKT
ncbi:nucleolar protein 8-like [Ctenocephalides felis]|uniref:nucleolar protein 8-like n=1 Tax=Ctenocephalides felis TaxID=7515 RepID=UPI000E6E111D|nr:nucleolar protein 8-like [Ctenocephalides felis]